MENFICVQCGTQFSEMAKPPLRCPICEDERQFVRHGGQEWTTLKRLAADHQNRFEEEAPQLLGIGTKPEFAIGQRALLVQSPAGNLLWDCISLLGTRRWRKSRGAEVFGRSRSRIRTFILRWSNGRSISTRRYIYTPRIASGSCARVRAFSFGKVQPFRFGMI